MKYKCEYCGLESEGNNCPNCGAPHLITSTNNNEAATNSDATDSNTASRYTNNSHANNSHTTNSYTANSHAADSYTTDNYSGNRHTANSYTPKTNMFNATIPKYKKRVTERAGFVVFLLWIFFPAGLFFMWKNKIFKFLPRVVITLFFAAVAYAIVKTNGTTDMINTAATGNEKAVEVEVTNTPAPTPVSTSTPTPALTPTTSPTPAKKPLSKREKFIKGVTSKSGVNKKTAGNLYDLFQKQLGFKKVYIIEKTDKEKAAYSFYADKFNVTVVFKKDGVSAIKWGNYILYDGKEIKMDKKDLLDRYLVDDVKYYLYAKIIINDNIQTPSTSQFPKMRASGIGMKRKGKIVAVQGYFDAQNTHGAIVRSKYTIEFSVTNLDENIYKPVYINIDGEVKGKWIDLD